MKVVLVVLLLVGLCAAASVEVTSQFISWQHQHGKQYGSKEEFNYRLSVYEKNLDIVANMNAKAVNKVFGVTKFMDLTTEEFKSTVLMTKMPPLQDPRTGPKAANNFTNFQAPNSFTWVGSGKITPVYNQGQCGSCWAFSATENIEATWAIAGNPLASLSMQQIVSCDTLDYGCGGGWPYHAYQYVISAGGLEYYNNYPYTAENTACAFNRAYIDARLSSWVYVTQSQNEAQMVNYLSSTAPLSVCVDAETWQYYTGGILMAADCSTSIDHCVQAVGYNLGGSPYWVIRNSWGTDWGQNGFIYLQYGADTCAVAQVVTSSIAA